MSPIRMAVRILTRRPAQEAEGVRQQDQTHSQEWSSSSCHPSPCKYDCQRDPSGYLLSRSRWRHRGRRGQHGPHRPVSHSIRHIQDVADILFICQILGDHPPVRMYSLWPLHRRQNGGSHSDPHLCIGQCTHISICRRFDFCDY